MSWLQISISVDQSSANKAEALLLNQGACSVTLKDAADEPILEPAPDEIRLWQKIIVTGLFENTPTTQDALIKKLRSSFPPQKHRTPVEIEINILEDQNWTRSWMEHFQAMKFGERLWICPHHIEPPRPEAINLRLDPGLAFGTGTHPTTSLCLSWLDLHCRHQENLLDYGCGSGVLAIAALMLGVKNADGVDIDNQALEASKMNAATNKVASRFQLYTSDQFRIRQRNKQEPKKYEIVIANILSGPLLELAPALADHTQTNGDIVLSGILQEQSDEVLKAYTRYFEMSPPTVMEDWVLLHGRKL